MWPMTGSTAARRFISRVEGIAVQRLGIEQEPSVLRDVTG
jgi:hypothetical protein